MMKSKHLALLPLFYLLSMCLISCNDDSGELTPEITAGFSVISATTSAGESITFSDNSTGDITSWSWEFQGGSPTTSSSKDPIVTYEKEGSFQVKLTVSDGNSSKVFTQDNFVSIGHAVPSGLAARYLLNNNATDETTNNHDGTVVKRSGASSEPEFTTDRFGNTNSAIDFKGNGGIKITDATSLDFTTEFSASFWAKHGSAKNSWETFFSKGGSDNESYAFFLHQTGYYHPVLTTSDNIRKNYNTPVQSNAFNDTWLHFTITFDGNDIKVYQNNSLIYTGVVANGSSLIQIGPNNNELHIGYRANGTFLKGMMDDIRFYNRALSVKEVGKIYQSEK